MLTKLQIELSPLRLPLTKHFNVNFESRLDSNSYSPKYEVGGLSLKRRNGTAQTSFQSRVYSRILIRQASDMTCPITCVEMTLKEIALKEGVVRIP